MKLEAPVNPNYAATVIRINAIKELDNCDNVVSIPMFGYNAIVSKDVQVGDIGIFFSAETQLSDEYARMNNLYRHGDRNDDPGASGYLEDTRRVKAIKFRGNPSNALFMPLESLDYLDSNPAFTDGLKVGDTFDQLDGHEICKKYVIKEPGIQKLQPKKERSIDEKQFPVHLSTENYFRNADRIGEDEFVVVTQKLHGTSVRFGRVQVEHKDTLLGRLARSVGISINYKPSFIVGSRKVVKSIDGR